VGEEEVGAVAHALERLARNPELRTRIGDAARAVAQGEHGLGRVAEAYVAAIEEAAGGDAVRNAFVREIARAAQETGLAADGQALSDVAARVREVGPGH